MGLRHLYRAGTAPAITPGVGGSGLLVKRVESEDARNLVSPLSRLPFLEVVCAWSRCGLEGTGSPGAGSQMEVLLAAQGSLGREGTMPGL